MSTTCDTVTAVDVLDQLVTAEQPGLSPEAARALLDLRFSPEAVRRMSELAEKNQQGTISEAEQAALERYRRVGHFLNIVQAKARVCLAGLGGTES